MKKLQEPEWIKLGVSQDFHQRILCTFFNQITQITLPEDDNIYDYAVPVDRLLSDIEQNLEGTVKRLFKLTALTHIEQLSAGHWLTLEDRHLRLHVKRSAELQKIVQVDGTKIVILDQSHTLSETHSPTSSGPKGSEEISQRPSATQQATLNYVDPLNYISSEIESPFTIRRLDQIVTYLDGVVLPFEEVGEQLKIPISERKLVFDATNRLGLTHQESEYLKLDFLGVRIARLPREERLKTLAMMASRLRSETKLQQARQTTDDSNP